MSQIWITALPWKPTEFYQSLSQPNVPHKYKWRWENDLVNFLGSPLWEKAEHKLNFNMPLYPYMLSTQCGKQMVTRSMTLLLCTGSISTLISVLQAWMKGQVLSFQEACESPACPVVWPRAHPHEYFLCFCCSTAYCTFPAMKKSSQLLLFSVKYCMHWNSNNSGNVSFGIAPSRAQDVIRTEHELILCQSLSLVQIGRELAHAETRHMTVRNVEAQN